jgi:hypothetical protein
VTQPVIAKEKPYKKGSSGRDASPKKPDILGELLNTRAAATHEDVEELKKITHQRPESGKKQSSKSCASRSKKKKKTTQYIDEELAGKLDKARDLLKTMVPQDARRGVTKSAIVNHAVDVIMREFAIKGEKSILLQKISTDTIHEKRNSGRKRSKK